MTQSKKSKDNKITKNSNNNVKKTETKKVGKVEEKENKLKKLGESIITSYEEPEADKSAAIKESMKKEDSPKMKLIIQNRKLIVAFIIGLVVGLIIMAIFIPDRIAKLSNGEEVIVQIGDKTVTANELYTDMKEYYSVTLLLDKIDNIVLTDLYPETNDMKTTVNETADYYISMYNTSYGYTEEEFLSTNGFSSHDAFIEYLTLDYRRNEYYKEYVKGLITDSEIKTYYDSNVYGDISSKYISIDSSEDPDAAKALAEEIIEKLNNGSTYDQVTTDYKDKITVKDLSYVAFDNDLGDEYMTELKKLSDNTYSTEPVEDSNTYKIIFRGDQKDKAVLDDVKDKIVDALVTEKENNDSTLYYKALDNLRKENNVNIKDTDLLSKYNNYIKEKTTVDTSSSSEQ